MKTKLGGSEFEVQWKWVYDILFRIDEKGGFVLGIWWRRELRKSLIRHNGKPWQRLPSCTLSLSLSLWALNLGFCRVI
jgi:hypothetical protein